MTITTPHGRALSALGHDARLSIFRLLVKAGDWALARPQVLALYIGLSLGGALAVGLMFQLWVALA